MEGGFTRSFSKLKNPSRSRRLQKWWHQAFHDHAEGVQESSGVKYTYKE
jgi:hypothetical protein